MALSGLLSNAPVRASKVSASLIHGFVDENDTCWNLNGQTCRSTGGARNGQRASCPKDCVPKLSKRPVDFAVVPEHYFKKNALQ